MKVTALLLLLELTVEHTRADSTADGGACATVANELLMSGDLLPDSLKFSTPGTSPAQSLLLGTEQF